MSYIDLAYYKTDYLGIDPGDDTELTRYIVRASDFVDLLTGNTITDIDDLYTIQIKCIKKATAAFTEFFVVNGDVFSEHSSGSEKIGQWSVSNSAAKKEIMSSTGIGWISESGLSQTIVDVIGECYCDSNLI